MSSNPTAETAKQEVVITRIFGAPRELVWKVWTDPQHVARWWSPRMFSVPFCEMDVRPGGKMRIDMLGPDGVVYPDNGVFHEIIPPERLVFTSRALEDENGDAQLEVLNTVTFEEFNGITRMTLRATVIKATPEAMGALGGMEQGWSESFYKLSEYLEEIQGQPQQAAAQHPDLKNLERLVGTWKVTGGAEGTVRYEWMDGGFFLMQHFDLEHGGHKVKGIEIIGHVQPFGGEASADIKTRSYDNMGNTFDYVYELDGGILTIWAGEKGSPAFYRGTFSSDGSSASGEWVYPDGGGYQSTMTRVQ